MENQPPLPQSSPSPSDLPPQQGFSPPPGALPQGYGLAPPQGYMPAFAPEAMMKRQGGTAVKVWGILLLITALLSAINVMSGVATGLGGGMNTGQFIIGQDEQTKQEMVKLIQNMQSKITSSPLYWVSIVGEGVLMLITFVASIQLLRNKVAGRKTAILRAAFALALLPVWGFYMVDVMSGAMEEEGVFMRNLVHRQVEKQNAGTNAPGANQEYVKSSRMARADEAIDSMMPIMKGMSFAGVIFSVLVAMLFDGVLLYFMTRPKVKDYLEFQAKNADMSGLAFNAALGLPLYAPPDFAKSATSTPPSVIPNISGIAAPGPEGMSGQMNTGESNKPS